MKKMQMSLIIRKQKIIEEQDVVDVENPVIEKYVIIVSKEHLTY